MKTTNRSTTIITEAKGRTTMRLANCLLCVSALTLASSGSSEAALNWFQSYGSPGTGADVLATVVIDDEANAYVAGASEDASGGWNSVVLKYSNAGDSDWTDSYDGSPAADDLWMDAKPYGFEGVVVTGLVTDSGAGKMATARYDADGSQLWLTSSSFTGSVWSEGLKTVVLADGDAVSAGISALSDNSQEVAVAKYDETGAELWATTWTSAPGRLHEVAGALEIGSGEVVITGSVRDVSDDTGTTSDLFALRLDSSGGEVWSYSYDSGDGDAVSALALTSGGSIAIGGQTDLVDARALVVQLTSAGVESWVSTYGSAGNSVEVTDLDTDSEANLIVVGSQEDDQGNEDYLTLKFASDGSLVWDALYDGSVGGTDRAVGVVLDAEDRIHVTGTTETVGANDPSSGMTTIQYSASGVENWTELYELSDTTFAAALAISIDTSDQLFVGGSIFTETGAGADMAVLAYGGIPTDVEDTMPNSVPTHVELGKNFPNPARFATTLRYALPKRDHVRISLFDATGRLVSVAVDEEAEAGYHQTELDLGSLSSGVYFYRMETHDGRRTRKLTVSR